MTIFGIPVKELFLFLLAFSTAAFVAWSRIADANTKKKEQEAQRKREAEAGLLPIPTRCEEHGKTIVHLETQITGIKDDIREIKERLQSVGA